MRIPTWTERESLAYCCEIASRSTVMVELGTYIGASAKVMLLANPQLHLWCVDIFSAFAFNREVCEIFLRDEIHQGRCKLITGDSKHAAGMLQHMKGKIDAVWCDDGHAEEDLIRDISSFLPLLKTGGIMWGHDWEGDNNVARGVLSMIPREQLFFPVPRVWATIKK